MKLPKSDISEIKHLVSQVKCDGVVVLELASLYLRVNTLLLGLLWSDGGFRSERHLAVLDLLLFLHLPLLPLCLLSDHGVFLFSSRERFCGEKRETMTRQDITGHLYMKRGGVTVSLLQKWQLNHKLLTEKWSFATVKLFYWESITEKIQCSAS